MASFMIVPTNDASLRKYMDLGCFKVWFVWRKRCVISLWLISQCSWDISGSDYCHWTTDNSLNLSEQYGNIMLACFLGLIIMFPV